MGKKWESALIVLAIITMLVVSIFSLSTYQRLSSNMPTSQKVFSNSQMSVVELKSKTNDDIISYGTAIFIDDDGTLTSNAHMVAYKQAGVYKEFKSFAIRFSFEAEYRPVSLLKYDWHQDLSILKLDNLENVKFKKIKISDSSRILSGDKVYAVGNGMNHGIGITQGLISIPQVNIDYEDNVRSVIQCDLIINEGNSGGALLDERGKLIGIVTFRLKDSNGIVIYGIAFCIPSNVLMEYYKLIL